MPQGRIAKIIETELMQAYNSMISDNRVRSLAEKLSAQHRWLHLHHAARYITLLGYEEAAHLFSLNQEDIMRTIRVNTLVTNVTEVRRRLEGKGFKTRPHPYIEYGIVIDQEPYSIGATVEYMEGLYTIQGPASMLAVPALRPEEHKGIIADCCAGAGIKTTQIAQHNPRKPIIAFDINKRKLLALKNNASRLSATNIVAFNADARTMSSYATFSAVLVDAPCSGEGLVPFPWGRWKRSFADIIGRVKLQYQLLNEALNAVKPGGTVVYSTCTLSVEENEYLVSLVARTRGDVEIEDPGINGGARGVTRYQGLSIASEAVKCRRFYPHIHRTEGFTICRLRKTS